MADNLPYGPSTDGVHARNNTKIYLVVNKGGGAERVGRVQSFRQDIANNVQVIDELGRAFAVELKKGITHYTFTIAKFYCRGDVFEDLKLGAIFSLAVRDAAGVDDAANGHLETLEYFRYCSMANVSSDYTTGQAVVGQNATVVTIGAGLNAPQSGAIE